MLRGILPGFALPCPTTRERRNAGAGITVVTVLADPAVDGLARCLPGRQRLDAADGDRAWEADPASSPHRLVAAIEPLSAAERDRLLGAQP